MDALDELRQLLMRREQLLLRELKERLEDRAKRVQDVAGVLPQAVTLSHDRSGAELTRALQPAVEGSIRESVERRPQIFVEALHPIIGPIVRRSIAESLRGLLQGLNQTLEHTFSVQGLRWRYEAFRTGRSFAEIVLLRSLVYRVEQVFLIHRQTSLALLQVSAADTTGKDADLLAGMLSAIQDFARDGFQAGADESLEEFRVGGMEVWIAPGPAAYLAAVIRGSAPRDLRGAMEEAIDNVHILRGAELAAFNGDAEVFEPLRPELEACLRAHYQKEQAAPPSGRSAPRRNTLAWLALAALGTVLVTLSVLALQSRGRWQDFLRRLTAEPGLAVTGAEHRWLGASVVNGLRDPLAADPAGLARAAGVNPARVRFAWKNFLAMDAGSVRRRFEQRFPVPPGAQLAVAEDGTVTVAGYAPYEWMERVRREATQLPGVRGLAAGGATVFYDPALVRARFQDAFPLPPGVEAKVEHGTILLSGRAPEGWLARVREGASRVPGVEGIVETGLEVAYDPAVVLRRFTERFGLPETVNTSVGEDGTLTLSGEAQHAWLTRVRQTTAAEPIPGVPAVRERDLTDLDEQTFQQTKAVIENAFIYFLPGKESFATEGFAALSRLPDEIRRCQTAARRLGNDLTIEVRGSADNTGAEAKNVDLSQRRAMAARDFLAACGLDPALFQPTGLGGPADRTAVEPAQRRVAFRVSTRVSSAPTTP